MNLSSGLTSSPASCSNPCPALPARARKLVPLSLSLLIAALFAAPNFAADWTAGSNDAGKTVYGNSTGADASSNHDGEPSGNTLTIDSDVSLTGAYGADSPGAEATNNQVWIKGGNFSGNIYGGRSDGSTAAAITNNRVTITQSDDGLLMPAFSNTVYRIVGGGNAPTASVPFPVVSDVSYNTVTATGVDIPSGEIAGGFLERGNGSVVSHNSVILTDLGQFGAAIGGRISGGASDIRENSVTVTNSSGYTIRGGYISGGHPGDVMNNTVIVNTSGEAMTIRGEGIQGGATYGLSGACPDDKCRVSGNTVTINDPTNSLEVLRWNNVAGGYAGLYADSNVVTINGGTYRYSVWGGFQYNAASQSGTVRGTAKNNIVSLNAGTFLNDIYGAEGVSTNSVGVDVTGNRVNVGGPVSVTGTIYGGYDGGNNPDISDFFTDNTLFLTVAPTSIANVQNFEYIVFDYAADGNANISKLTTDTDQNIHIQVGEKSGGDPLAVTFGGEIAGTGTIIKDAAGTLILSAANTYTGKTIVEAGTLALGSAATLTSEGLILHGGASFDATAAATLPAFPTVSVQNVTPGTPAVYHGTLKGDGANLDFTLPHNFSTADTLLNVTGGDAEIEGANVTVQVDGGTP
ncbi:MAG: autotransporter-associated beta strand repeat-containing protein, partial [Burkholderiales bacterium]|nr:autotransporter-associated beta strand repeat-containing protein [Burkholderiales bacterium]